MGRGVAQVVSSVLGSGGPELSTGVGVAGRRRWRSRGGMMMKAMTVAVVVAAAALGRVAAQMEEEEEDCKAAVQSERLDAGAEYGQCLEISVVLVNDPNHEHDAGQQGSLGHDCVHGDQFHTSQQPDRSIVHQSDCPVGWNCNFVTAHNSDSTVDTTAGTHLQACRNGLYCHPNGRREDDRGLCDHCANCAAGNGLNEFQACGNCRTTFYPRVDQYSVLRIKDYCDPDDSTIKEAECNGMMGCHWAGAGKCRPGPHAEPRHKDDDHIDLDFPTASTNDEHVTLRPDQEFFVEMGQRGHGNGVVRSPVVVFSKPQGAAGAKTVEAAGMYLKLAMLNGHPRRISWEQTGKISPNCGFDASSPDAHLHVQVDGLSRNNPLRGITATCDSPENPSHCRDTNTPWPMTECGFGTYDGYYQKNDGDQVPKFAGMRWVDHDNNTIPGSSLPVDCSQDMCGLEPTDITPVQIYVTWAGTDKDDRDMTSGGLTFESFQQYSTFTAIQAAKDGATTLAEKSRQCVITKNC